MANWFTGPMRDKDPEQEAFLRSREGHMGHPTAPGRREPNVPRRGLESTPDGMPGIPRLLPGGHIPGLPGTSPAGPIQPGIEYETDE